MIKDTTFRRVLAMEIVKCNSFYERKHDYLMQQFALIEPQCRQIERRQVVPHERWRDVQYQSLKRSFIELYRKLSYEICIRILCGLGRRMQMRMGA